MHKFQVHHQQGLARAGECQTSHGDFDTPNFMPVGTQASVKGVDCERIREAGAQITLVNTYHLWLRPGSELINRLGGIQSFCNWQGPILSDSGGFQIFSLQGIRTLTEEGVEFRSHLDGSKRFLSPEKSVQIQEELGVDIAMVLDECPAADRPYDEIASSLQLTHRWAKRSLDASSSEQTALFGITQGAGHSDLRTESAQYLSELNFDGYGIGGLSVGEPKEVMYEVLSYHPQQLPQSKLRYLMGVGTPQDLVEGVKNGVDLFDCVMPTRSGRFGRAFVGGESPWINLKNSCHREDLDPLDSDCSCIACRNYSRAYIHHLFRCQEMLGPQLVSIHNLVHYLELMKKMRELIRENKFEQFYSGEMKRWESFQEARGE